MVLRVLTHPAPSRLDPNSTPRQLADSLPDDVQVIGFSWQRAFLGRYDVLHVHWPEHLFGRRGAKGRILALLGRPLLWWTRLRRIPRVWTVHNLEPHEARSATARRTIGLWERAADARVYMYDVALPGDPGPLDTVIRRGMQSVPAGVRGGREPQGLLNFGKIRPYKGIETLLAAYARLPAERRPGLTVAGSPSVPEYADELRGLAAGIPDVVLDFRWLQGEELAELILGTRLVVLPYRRIYNSGVVINALALGRPALVPDSPTMRELREEVGGDWVMLFQELTPEALLDAYARSSGTREAAPPDLSRRDWSVIGRQYAALYRRAVAAIRRR